MRIDEVSSQPATSAEVFFKLSVFCARNLIPACDGLYASRFGPRSGQARFVRNQTLPT